MRHLPCGPQQLWADIATAANLSSRQRVDHSQRRKVCGADMVHSYLKIQVSKTMAPKEQKALVIPYNGADFVVQSVTVPSPAPGEILVRVDATALNPADWKMKDLVPDMLQYPAVLGFDGAGVVEEVGEGVTSLTTGDRVYAFLLLPVSCVRDNEELTRLL